MSKAETKKLTVTVTSVASRGDQVVLGLETGSIEVQQGSHADLPKVKAGTSIEVQVSEQDEKALGTGNVVPGALVGITVQTPAAQPRTSDGSSS